MSWQDDLRQLDQALAQGQLSADEYRRRRDQLLAAAAGTGTPQQPPAPEQPIQQQPPSGPLPVQQPPSGPIPVQQPPAAQQPPQQQNPSGPFAPPFRWEASNPDATQVVAGPNSAADRTQIVSQQQPEAERTQTLRPLSGPPSQFGQQPPAPPWQSHQPDPAAPPWGTDDGPVSMPQPTWLSHGPEVFSTDSGESKKGKVWLIVAAVVVVIGLGVGAFFFFGNKKDNPSPPVAQSTSQTPTTKPKDNLSVADLDGTPGDVANITTFAEAERKGFMTADENKIYKTNDAGKTRMAIATQADGITVYIFTAEFTSASKAATVADALIQQQITYGLKTRDGQPQGVRATDISKPDEKLAAIRAHYVHNGTVIRIQVAGTDMTQVGTAYDKVIKDQLEVLSATG
jgi:hypothetical protein